MKGKCLEPEAEGPPPAWGLSVVAGLSPAASHPRFTERGCAAQLRHRNEPGQMAVSALPIAGACVSCGS